MQKTPASLLERLRGTFDPEAWARFVALYAPLIHSWARRVGSQEQDAADLTQDVFATLLQVLPTFTYDRDKSFRRWLRTVTLNRWRNVRRQWDRQVLQGAEGNLNQLEAPDDLEAVWEAEYRQRLVARLLELMRRDFKETTWRACWETVAMGRPAGEVAQELGLTIGAVYAAQFRVLNRLRAELQDLPE